MTIREHLGRANEKLKQCKIPSAALDAELLLSLVLNTSRIFLLSHPEQPVFEPSARRFRSLLLERRKQRPLAYLLKKKEFYGFEFFVDDRVLIPRPETESLVEEVLKTVSNNKPLTIADVGTGSGCLAIVFAKFLPRASVTAIDISREALDVARENAKRHGVNRRITFREGNLLKPLSNAYDIVVANLPYLPSAEVDTPTYPEITFEPREALDGGQEGFECIEQLLHEVPENLKSGGKIFLEIHPPHAANIVRTAHRYFPHAKICIKKDLSNRERILVIRQPEIPAYLARCESTSTPDRT